MVDVGCAPIRTPSEKDGWVRRKSGPVGLTAGGGKGDGGMDGGRLATDWGDGSGVVGCWHGAVGNGAAMSSLMSEVRWGTLVGCFSR